MIVCDYCGSNTEFIDSSVIYGKSYGMIYLCRKCNAYVGVHKGTDKPLGRLANAELRHWKKQAHLYFDKIWKNNNLTRKEAYKWLSEHLNIDVNDTHIGMFDIDKCKDTIYYSKQLLNDLRRCDLDFGVNPETEYYEL